MVNFIKNLGTTEIIIIALILLLFMGGKKMKELSRGLGESSKELKRIKDDIKPKKKEVSEEE